MYNEINEIKKIINSNKIKKYDVINGVENVLEDVTYINNLLNGLLVKLKSDLLEDIKLLNEYATVLSDGSSLVIELNELIELAKDIEYINNIEECYSYQLRDEALVNLYNVLVKGWHDARQLAWQVRPLIEYFRISPRNRTTQAIISDKLLKQSKKKWLTQSSIIYLNNLRVYQDIVILLNNMNLDDLISELIDICDDNISLIKQRSATDGGYDDVVKGLDYYYKYKYLLKSHKINFI